MQSTSNDQVAAKVRGLAAERRYRLEEIASLIGVSRMGISRRLRGEVEFRVRELVALATHFNVPVGYFFGEAASVPKSVA